MRDWLVVQIISQEKRTMRKKHDTEKHSIERVRVFFFFAKFKYPALTQYHSDCKHRWTSSFLGRRAIIFRLAEFLKYLSNLPVFCFVFFLFFFFFHAFNEPKNQTMEEKGEEKQRERRKERRASEYAVTFLHWLYFGNVFKRKKTPR